MSAPAEALDRRWAASFRRLCVAAFCTLALIAGEAAAQEAASTPAAAQSAVQMADALISSVEGFRPGAVDLATGGEAPQLSSEFFDQLDRFFAEADREIRSYRAESADLEALREALLAMRSRVFEIERLAQTRTDNLKARLDAAGEPPRGLDRGTRGASRTARAYRGRVGGIAGAGPARRRGAAHDQPAARGGRRGVLEPDLAELSGARPEPAGAGDLAAGSEPGRRRRRTLVEGSAGLSDQPGPPAGDPRRAAGAAPACGARHRSHLQSAPRAGP